MEPTPTPSERIVAIAQQIRGRRPLNSVAGIGPDLDQPTVPKMGRGKSLVTIPKRVEVVAAIEPVHGVDLKRKPTSDKGQCVVAHMFYVPRRLRNWP